MNWFFILITLFVSQVSTGQIRIDHVIAVVPDLEEAKQGYIRKGFRIKEGRPHENGLLNAHVKFPNHSSFELMTVQGIAIDATARQYQKLLTEREGGAFIALTGHHTDSLKTWLKELNIAFIETSGKLWDYLSFPQDSYLAHLFFIDYHIDTNTLNDPTDHPNGMTRIQNVEIEGGQKVRQFLEHVGLRLDEKTSAFSTPTGDIRLIQRANEKKRPRLLSITFAGIEAGPLEINW